MSGWSSRGRVVGLALISAGLGTVCSATPQPAAARDIAPARVTADGPTAVAVTASGTSYVGFAGGGQLVRIGPQGGGRGVVPLDRAEPVDGLAASRSGDIWVDYGASVSLLSPGGRVLEHFDHAHAGDCAGSAPARYGGIAVGGGRVWVADRCDDTMTVYSQHGRRLSTVDLPGRGHPRGIAYGAAQSGRGATVYVALPDSGRVVAYLARQALRSAGPWRSARIPRPRGGARPEPAGLAVDRFGQLTVADAANNAVYLLDTNHGFGRYRTLGHPPRSGRAAGRLSSPGAVAQHAQDRGSFSGNLFIADTGNSRVQRWDTGGYTYWATRVRPGHGGPAGSSPASGVPPDGPPVNLAPPTVVGTPSVGTALTCTPGSWSGDVTGYSYAWTRNGIPIAHTAWSRYVVLNADVGQQLACTVAATNARGSAGAVSTQRLVGGPSGHAPQSTAPPTVTGSPTLGSTLTCDPGAWTAADSLAVLWQRDGVTIGNGGWTHTVTADDLGTAVQCLVVASNGSGLGAVRSDPAATGPCSGAPGVVIDGGAAGTAYARVTLTVHPPPGATTVQVSNRADLAGATVVPIPAGCTLDWLMPAIPGLPLAWTVYVRFDGTGPTYSDSILVSVPG